MKMEHCQKCKKQIEVMNKKKSDYNRNETVFTENNEVSFGRREKTATINTICLCDSDYFDLLQLLADKGYITGKQSMEFYKA